MKKCLFALFLLSSLVLSSCSPIATEVATTAPLATAESAPTQPPPSTEWQLSPDGHVYYKESELYGGMFTINKEHPENVEQYWEDTIRGLWNLNFVSQNKDFLNQFPTDDSLIEYLNNGGGPVENLWIPVKYPNPSQQFWYQATMEPVEGAVDLSKIGLSIEKPSQEDITNFSPSYGTGPEFILFGGPYLQVRITVEKYDGENILLLNYQSISTEYTPGGVISLLYEPNEPRENLEAASQLIMSWAIIMHKVKYCDTSLNPIRLDTGNQSQPSNQEFQNMRNSETSPIEIR
jgi:hypothetical protein